MCSAEFACESAPQIGPILGLLIIETDRRTGGVKSPFELFRLAFVLKLASNFTASVIQES